MYRLLVLAACLTSLALPSTVHGEKPMATRLNRPAHSAAPLAIFNPLIPQLSVVQIPVYIPSWLPPSLHLGKLGPAMQYPASKTGYYIGLSNYRDTSGWTNCNACLPFLISGDQGKAAPPKPSPGPLGDRVNVVRVDKARVGYRVEVLGGSMREYFQWSIGNNTYSIRIDGPVSNATYAAVARSVVLAHVVRPAPRPSTTLLDVQGTGIHTTQWFHAPSEWKIAWSYDCTAFGYRGNFSVDLWSGPTSLVDGVSNVLGMRGSGMTYEHQGGRFYLKINSECNWHIRAYL
jgi:hypothetical protein